MSIVESLQGLSLDAKGFLAIVLLLWVLSEVRHVRRHRANLRVIQRLQMGIGPTDGAVLEAHRLPEVRHGAALTLGEVVPRGEAAGQHFVGAIKNAGPRFAEDIQVTASLGTIAADVVSAPRRLGPHSAAAAVDVMLPFGFLTPADVLGALQSGEPLRVRVTFTDGTPTPHAFEECFAFAQEPNSLADASPMWVSRRVSCAGERIEDGSRGS